MLAHPQSTHTPHFKSSQSRTRWAMNEFTQCAVVKEKPSTETKMIFVISFFISVLTLNILTWESRRLTDAGVGLKWTLAELHFAARHRLRWTYTTSIELMDVHVKISNVSNNEASVCTIIGKLGLQTALDPGCVWCHREEISLIWSSQAQKPHPICSSDLLLRRNSQPVGSK